MGIGKELDPDYRERLQMSRQGRLAIQGRGVILDIFLGRSGSILGSS